MAEERPGRVIPDWREKVSQDLDYYLDTEEGRKELSEMIKAESEAILEYISKYRQRVKDIIWLSRFCLGCTYFSQLRRNYYRCGKHDARLVKPFFGKPLWATVTTSSGQKELLITGVNWDEKSFNISDLVVEETMRRINRGHPYTCFQPAETG